MCPITYVLCNGGFLYHVLVEGGGHAGAAMPPKFLTNTYYNIGNVLLICPHAEN